MAAPTITSGSVTTFANINAADFSITISAQQSGRVLVLCNLAKDDTTTVSLISALAFDSAGVNATLSGGEIVEQGSTQIAQEGTRSSQCGIYFIKDADLPTSSGSYLFEPTFDSDIDGYQWVCFEILGCPDEAYDNIVQNVNLADVSGGVAFSDSITPTVNDCLIVDVWAISTSFSPTITSTETQVAAVALQNAGGVVSQFTQVTAASKAMEENSDQLSQRRAWTLLSFSGVAAGGTIYSRTLSSSLNVSDIEERYTNLSRSLLSNIDASDQLVGEALFFRILSSGLDINDIISRLVTSDVVISRTLQSAIALNDGLLTYRDLSRLLATELAVGDIVLRQTVLSRLLADDIEVSSSVSRLITTLGLINRVLSSNIDINDTQYAYKLLTRTLSDVFYLSDSIIRTLVEAGVIILERNLSDSLSVSDSVVRNLLLTRLLSENISLNDAIIREIVAEFISIILTGVETENINLGIEIKNILLDSRDI